MFRNVLLMIVVGGGALVACQRGSAAAPPPASGTMIPASAPAQPPISPTGPSAVAAPAAGPSAMPATAVAGKWLTALRATDAKAITALTELPFLADGFDTVTGPIRDKCRQAAEGGPKARWLRMRATNDAALEELLGCLLMDDLVVTSIPKYAPDAWPATPPGPGRGASGALKVVEPAQLAKRLGRYKKEVKALASTHALVEVSYTDNNGITVYAVLAVRDGRVAAFLSDQKFEH